MKKSFKGFTLVEVLIVIIIIGILIAALLPRLVGLQARGRDTWAMSIAREAANGISVLMADGGAITTPAGLDSAAAVVCLGNATDLATAKGNLSTVLSSIPKVPSGTVTTYGDDTACASGEVAVMFEDQFNAVVAVEVELEWNANFVMPATTAAVDTVAEVQALIDADTTSTWDHYAVIVG